MAHTVEAPPTTQVEPVTEVLHGVEVTDPYRWLEEQNSPRTRKWLDEQVEYSCSFLRSLPCRDRIRRSVQELLAVEKASEPWKVRDRYFYLKRAGHSQQPTIMLRESEAGDEIALVDPEETDHTGKTTVSIMRISADANLLAYSTRQGGEDPCAIEFVDVRTRERLRDRLPRGFCRGLAFAADGRGFYYSHEPIETRLSSSVAVYYHVFGTDDQHDTVVFVGGEGPKLQLFLVSSPCGKWLGYYKLFGVDPRKIEFLVQDVAEGSRPRPIVEQMEGLFDPVLLTDRLLALTNWKAPNCRIVEIDMNHPGRENWRDIVSERDSVIQGIAVVGDSIFVTSVRDISTSLEEFDFSGKKLATIPLPAEGTASLFPCQPDTDVLFYRFTSFVHPPSILSYSARTRKQATWAGNHLTVDASSIETERVCYPSKDGTLVPMFLVSRKGLRDTGPLPTFLTGYGGFGNSVTPQFTAYAMFLIERGCLFAVANLRGGGEFGESWHLAAKREKRQIAIDDFIAAAEWLIAEAHTVHDRLAIGGGSNAGLLVGAALTQRPDLFRAVVCLGPLLDMVRYHLFDYADSWVDEYGSAEVERDFHALLSYSPYHAVKDGVAYPAVMMISGDADTRCNPMHANKMTARLQAATTSGYPVLLDYKRAWGHMPVQPLSTRIDSLTDRLAFLCHELELEV